MPSEDAQPPVHPFTTKLNELVNARFGSGRGRAAWLHREVNNLGVNLTPQAVSAWLRGESVPSIPRARVIETVLDAPDALVPLLGPVTGDSILGRLARLEETVDEIRLVVLELLSRPDRNRAASRKPPARR